MKTNKNVDNTFRQKRALQEVTKMTDEQLIGTINFGLRELKRLISHKPRNWFEEIEDTEKVMRLCDEELKRRGHA